MIVYGKNVAQQIARDPAGVQKIWVQKGLKDRKILDCLNGLGDIPVIQADKAQLDRLVENGVHQGVVIELADPKTCSLEELMALKTPDAPGFLVALDEVQDPHNVGAILRSADCAGAQGVILCRHNAAGLTPAAVKASTGAAYTVPVAVVTNLSQALKTLKKNGYWVAGADMDNARDYREGMFDADTVLVIGNEGKGISPLVKKQCDYMVKLPMKGTITSLNASVAAALLMYEVMRQREKPVHEGR